MGQTRLESTRSLDKWLFEKYTILLRQFNFLSRETVAEFERDKPSVVFYADLWPAVKGDNTRKISYYSPNFNVIFTNAKPLIADEKPSPELKVTEEVIEQAGLIYKVQFARGKFHELTHALISFLPYNKDLFREPFDYGMSSLFPLAKSEALAEGVADLFLKQLGEPYSNVVFALVLRKMTRDGLESDLNSVVNDEPRTVMQTRSHEWATLLRYRGTKELRNALRKPIGDRTNKREEIVYQKIGKQREEESKVRQYAKSGR